MNSAPQLSNPIHFNSRLGGVSGFDEAALVIAIVIDQALLELLWNLWTGVQAIPNANEVKSWSAMFGYQLFDLVAEAEVDGALTLALSGDQEEVVFVIPRLNNACDLNVSGLDITVYSDGDAVFHVKLNGLVDALWTEGAFTLRDLIPA